MLKNLCTLLSFFIAKSKKECNICFAILKKSQQALKFSTKATKYLNSISKTVSSKTNKCSHLGTTMFSRMIFCRVEFNGVLWSAMSAMKFIIFLGFLLSVSLMKRFLAIVNVLNVFGTLWDLLKCWLLENGTVKFQLINHFCSKNFLLLSYFSSKNLKRVQQLFCGIEKILARI